MPGPHDYVRYTQNPDDPFTSRTRAFLDNNLDTLNGDDPETWTRDKVKAAALMFEREDTARQNQIQSGHNAELFLSQHPEIVDTPENGVMFKHELNRMFGATLYTVVEYEAAYESLRASNFLALDAAVVAKQKKAADKARYVEQKAQAAQPSQEYLETLSLDEIRRLDTIENQKRMERIAREGGW